MRKMHWKIDSEKPNRSSSTWFLPREMTTGSEILVTKFNIFYEQPNENDRDSKIINDGDKARLHFVWAHLL